MKDLHEFTRKHDILICLDSDGTAIDAMTCKHRLAHGPCFIHEWKLEERYDEVLELWLQINLHGKTRGVNRFHALIVCLEELKKRGWVDDDISALKAWVDTTDKLSNDRLISAIEKTDAEILKKAYSWSKALDACIAKIPVDEKRVYDGVKEFLEYIYGKADIAVVTSATARSIREEWEHFGILQYVSVLTGQEIGPKQDCIKALLKYGYDKKNIVMTGDAPLDMESAKVNGVNFYPIITDREAESWKDYKEKYLKYLFEGSFAEVQNELIEKFLRG